MTDGIDLSQSPISNQTLQLSHSGCLLKLAIRSMRVLFKRILMRSMG